METRIADFLEHSLGAGRLAPNYPLLFAVAILLGLYLAVRRAQHSGLDPYQVFKAGVITVVTAFVSARLFVVLEKFGYYSARPVEVLYYWQDGLASSGAYIGGILAAIVSTWRLGLQPAKFLDCAAPSVALAICLGRVGCFLNGCCYGKHSDLPWAMTFPPDTEPVHPTQLYEALFGLVLFLFLSRFQKRERRDGESIALLFLLYSGARFFVEVFRGDERWMVAGTSVPQYLSVLGFVLSAAFLIAARKRTVRLMSFKEA